MGDCNLSHVTSVGKVVIARTHITVVPRLCDAETRRITGGWRVIKLSLLFVTGVTTCVEVKVPTFWRHIRGPRDQRLQEASWSKLWVEENYILPLPNIR